MQNKLKLRYCVISIIGSGILAFGFYNVHSFSGVTEGGVLGMTLLLNRLTNISVAIWGVVLNCLCYAIGWRTLGSRFIKYSLISALSFSLLYALFERFEPLWPQLAHMPLAAAIIGACFVGVGAGLCVRAGGAPGGDDALAMSLAHITKIKIQWIYLITDLIVLLLSLWYIPLSKIGYSLLTVIISGQIVGLIQKLPLEKHHTSGNQTE